MKRLIPPVVALAILASIYAVSTAHAAATLTPGTQINRVWSLTNNGGQSGLQVLGTISGTNLYAVKSGTATDLYAVRFAGGGLTGCSTAATSKLLYNAATKQFSCGTDQNTGGTNSGNVLTLGDARYVRKAGDTMTGALNVRATISGAVLVLSGNGSFSGGLVVVKGMSGATLEVLGTASGRDIFATKSVTGTYLYAATTFDGAGLASCSNATTSKLLWNSATKRFSCGTDTDTSNTYTAGQGLTLTVSSFKLSANHSGATIQASATLASSGALIWEGTATGNVLHVEKNITASGTIIGEGAFSGATLKGFGLGSCSTAATSKLLYSSTTNTFSCGTDQTAATPEVGTLSFSGAVLRLGDARYLKLSGGTVTGALTVSITGGNNATIGLKVLNTISGSIIHAEKSLSSSGTFVFRGTGSGNRLHIASVLSNSGGIISDSPLGISGSVLRGGVVSPSGKQAQVYASGSAIAVGSGRYLYVVPPTMSGWILGGGHVKVQTAGVTNTSTFRFRNVTKANRHFFTVPISIDSAELGSDTAATAYTLAANRDVGAYDTLSFDVATTSTTAPKGLMFSFWFYKP